jgi:hypothetical protein
MAPWGDDHGVMMAPFVPSDPAWPTLRPLVVERPVRHRAQPSEYVREGDILGGAQRLAVMDVTHLWSLRSFAGSAAQCGHQRFPRSSQPLHGLCDAANTADWRRIA